MAVEARQLDLFRPLNLGNRELVMDGINGSMFRGAQISYGAVDPISGVTTVTDNTMHIYGSTLTDAVQCKPAEVPVSRKRSRETNNTLLSSLPNQIESNRCSSFTFLGEDISSQIHLQQMEIDRFISQHTEKVRMEMEARRRRFSRRIAAAMEENIMKKLKAKEDEIEKMGKLNWALEEKVKSLSMENQIWRDLAQSNEATANALRYDLEQVLAQVQDDNLRQHHCLRRSDEASLMDDAQSCCSSNKLDEFDSTADWINQRCDDRACRRCGKEESCVLLLPCRHLCLCTVCGSSLHICPVCNSVKTASLHVNLSS